VLEPKARRVQRVIRAAKQNRRSHSGFVIMVKGFNFKISKNKNIIEIFGKKLILN
jgi:hypothetical protein